MRRLEERRRKLLGDAAHGSTFIIPVVLRADDDIMKRVRQHEHYSDFSRFTPRPPTSDATLNTSRRFGRSLR